MGINSKLTAESRKDCDREPQSNYFLLLTLRYFAFSQRTLHLTLSIQNTQIKYIKT